MSEGCKNKVTQYVPRRYGHKAISCNCGTISIHGVTLLCEECEERLSKEYPQGWMSTPGDTCIHGMYIGNHWDRSSCYKCEEGI